MFQGDYGSSEDAGPIGSLAKKEFTAGAEGDLLNNLRSHGRISLQPVSPFAATTDRPALAEPGAHRGVEAPFAPESRPPTDQWALKRFGQLGGGPLSVKPFPRSERRNLVTARHALDEIEELEIEKRHPQLNGRAHREMIGDQQQVPAARYVHPRRHARRARRDAATAANSGLPNWSSKATRRCGLTGHARGPSAPAQWRCFSSATVASAADRAAIC